MGECKNHEKMNKMTNPTCATDYTLSFKVTKTGMCPECGVSMVYKTDILNELLNEMMDNATLSNPKHVC